MVFNVTKLDKIRLIQTLYIHADPKGYGNEEYKFRDAIGENVIGLTDEECKDILSMDTPKLNGYLIDYHNGKPIKLNFEYKTNGDMLASSTAYDMRNGRYRFLEALLYVFNLDEIIITKKGYPQGMNEALDEYTKRAIEETQLLKGILIQTIKHSDKGIYWTFDTSKVQYKPPFMRQI